MQLNKVIMKAGREIYRLKQEEGRKKEQKRI